MYARMLAVAARRRIVAGGPSDRRHCSCRECAVSKTKGAQRQAERRTWMRDQ